MRVNITLGDLQDLNKIRGMFDSIDEEVCKLAWSMLTANPIFGIFRDMTFIPSPGKEIPVVWYIRKVSESLSSKERGYYNWKGLIIPILDAIISGSNKFKTKVYINFDKSLDKTTTIKEPWDNDMF